MVSDGRAGEVGDNDVLSDWCEGLQIPVPKHAAKNRSIQPQVRGTSRVIIQNVGVSRLQLRHRGSDPGPQFSNSRWVDLLKVYCRLDSRTRWSVLYGIDGQRVRGAGSNPQLDRLHLIRTQSLFSLRHKIIVTGRQSDTTKQIAALSVSDLNHRPIFSAKH